MDSGNTNLLVERPGNELTEDSYSKNVYINLFFLITNRHTFLQCQLRESGNSSRSCSFLKL